MTSKMKRSRPIRTLGVVITVCVILAGCGGSAEDTAPESPIATVPESPIATVPESPIATAPEFAAAMSEATPGVEWKHSRYQLTTDLGSPYISETVLPLSDTSWGAVDENGVLIVELNGEHVYHPVNSAWFINRMLSGYKATGDPEYLERATATADHIVDGSITDENGMWFPYHFEHSPGGLDMGTPWYSGMAQGMLLSTFVNLYEITGDSSWQEYADSVYQTYDAPRSATAPWFQAIEIVDDEVFLFFEEYPTKDDAQMNHVVNGNIYAMWGLYDYYRLTGDEAAQWLFDTAATSLRDSFGSYRNPGEPSWYAATDYGRTVWGAPENYHRGVINQLRRLAEMTGDDQFAEQADLLVQDHG